MSKGKIVFVHPDLGVGGAERLVIDAAVALKQKDFSVKFVTAHHDPEHCFQETVDGTFPVVVVGDWIPRDINGRFFALMAYIKMIWCALYVIFYERPDCVFCDLVSVQIPLLKLARYKVIFYCHFPDRLLSKPEGILKRLYRAPLNWLEEKSTGFADKVYVNSGFTKGVFKMTFSTLRFDPVILYPSLNTDAFDGMKKVESDFLDSKISKSDIVFLSINRYERKKNIELSIKALNCLRDIVPPEIWETVKLIIAGGFDERVTENKEYFLELSKIALDLNLQDRVIFLKSPSDVQKVALLKRCRALLYTPSDEHFGIVPLEAMYCSKPVIAVNSGGPTETVVNRETGFLVEPNEESFAMKMQYLIKEKDLRLKMCTAARDRVISKFSFQAFANQLDNDLTSLIKSK